MTLQYKLTHFVLQRHLWTHILELIHKLFDILPESHIQNECLRTL